MKRKLDSKGSSRFISKLKHSKGNQISGNVKKVKNKKKPVNKKFCNQLLALQKDIANKSAPAEKYLKRKSNDCLNQSFKKRKLEDNDEKKNTETIKIENVPQQNVKKSKNKYKHLALKALENTPTDNSAKPESSGRIDKIFKAKEKMNHESVNSSIPDNNTLKRDASQLKTSRSQSGRFNKSVNNELHSEVKNHGNKPNPQTKDEIWFDDVDEILIESSKSQSNDVSSLVKSNSNTEITKAVGMDCEMVGIGWKGEDSMLARVSIVNQFGHCLYDKFVKPREKVTDYRTKVSGIRPSDIVKGENFSVVQKEVYDIIKGKILVGHSIKNDLKVLFLDHPRKMIRDTSQFKPFRALKGGGTPSLKKLTEEILGVKIQEGEHNSVQDAQAAMRLYTKYKKRWEASIREKRFKKKTFSNNDNNEDEANELSD